MLGSGGEIYRGTEDYGTRKRRPRCPAGLSILEIEKRLFTLYSSDSPYEIKQGIRYYRNTDRLVSRAVNIIVINSDKNKNIYNSISECAKNLNIPRNKIKQCLSTGKSLKGYTFVLS